MKVYSEKYEALPLVKKLENAVADFSELNGYKPDAVELTLQEYKLLSLYYKPDFADYFPFAPISHVLGMKIIIKD